MQRSGRQASMQNPGACCWNWGSNGKYSAVEEGIWRREQGGKGTHCFAEGTVGGLRRARRTAPCPRWHQNTGGVPAIVPVDPYTFHTNTAYGHTYFSGWAVWAEQRGGGDACHPPMPSWPQPSCLDACTAGIVLYSTMGPLTGVLWCSHGPLAQHLLTCVR